MSLTTVVAVAAGLKERVYYFVSVLLVFILQVIRDVQLLALTFLEGGINVGYLRALLREVLAENVKENRKEVPGSSVLKDKDTASSEEHWVSAIRGLCRAIIKRDIELVSRALKAAPSLAKTRHDGQWSPLHAAVLSGSVEIVKLMLEQLGVDISVTDKSGPDTAEASVREAELGTSTTGTKGATPLHYACMTGNVEIIRALLERGADFDAPDGRGRKPVEYFDVRLHVEAMAVYQCLFEQWKKREEHYSESVNVDTLADMIRAGNFERFVSFLNKTPDLATKPTYYEYTLLHLAVVRQQSDFVKHLLTVAPSTLDKVDRRNNYDSDSSLASFAPPTFPHKYVRVATPLHYACLTGNLEIMGLLLRAGADWKVQDYKGRVPEELIYEFSEDKGRIKNEFVRMREEEARKRTKAEKGDEDVVKDEDGSEGEAFKDDEEGESMDVDDKAGDGSVKPDKEKDVQGALTKSKSPDEEPKREPKEDRKKSKPAEDPKPTIRPLEVVLGEKLIGQRGPVRVVANMIRLRENGWVDPDRPLVMLFLGSSGVGKTELAKQVALHLHGKNGLAADKGATVNEIEQEYGFVRIDMSEFQQTHTVSNLMGSPKGYVGYDDEGFLTGRLRKNPKAIVLLDEIEKAHPDVLTVFLQVFDDGRITDSKHGVIYCKDAVFIMTSNLASDEIKERAPLLRALVAETEAQGRPEEYLRIVGQFNRSIHPVLKRSLRRDEFLGRINQIVVFLPLSAEEIRDVIKGELGTWRKRAEEKHAIKLSWADEVVKKLAMAYDVNYGVRSVANETQRIAVQLIADAQIRGQLAKNWHAYLTTNDFGDIILKATDFKENVRFRRGCRFAYF